MSRPARRSGEYGFRPATGSVVLFWKNRGMISTAPPMLITTVTRAISSQGFLSIHACENFICFRSYQACAAFSSGMRATGSLLPRKVIQVL